MDDCLRSSSQQSFTFEWIITREKLKGRKLSLTRWKLFDRKAFSLLLRFQPPHLKQIVSHLNLTEFISRVVMKWRIIFRHCLKLMGKHYTYCVMTWSCSPAFLQLSTCEATYCSVQTHSHYAQMIRFSSEENITFQDFFHSCPNSAIRNVSGFGFFPKYNILFDLRLTGHIICTRSYKK